MRPIARVALQKSAAALLARCTKLVMLKHKVTTRALHARKLWKSRTRSLAPVRSTLSDRMAPSPGRCMYCEHSEGTAVDHFWPLASYPERAFTWQNLLWACSHCNSNDKRDQFPLDSQGAPLLIDPTSGEDPADHLELHPRTGRLVPLTDKGRASHKVYGLGRQFLETGRMDAWVSAQVHLESYARAVADGEMAYADVLRKTLVRAPHGAVQRYLLAISKTPLSAQHIRSAILGVLANHSEVYGWV